MSLTIYGDRRSGNCDKVQFTLSYLRIEHTWIEVDSVSGASRTPEYLEKNPFGQVPCALIPGLGYLSQSNAIIRRLAEGSALLPSDLTSRSYVDQWMFWEANNHEFFVAGCINHMTYMGLTKETRDPMRVKRGEEALAVMNRLLLGRNWLVGDHLTVADIALIAYSRHAERGGFDLTSMPSLRAWIGRCESELGL